MRSAEPGGLNVQVRIRGITFHPIELHLIPEVSSGVDPMQPYQQAWRTTLACMYLR